MVRNAEVTKILTDEKRVALSNGQTIAFDKLILTAGSHPFLPPFPGAYRQGVTTFRTIDDVHASGLWPGRVVTKVSPATAFWEAEPEHQDYLERYPNGYTCHFPRPGWKLPRGPKEVLPTTA